MQALPTTSRAGWLLLVHGIRILQLQLLEEDAVGISREHSFLGGQHRQSSRDPAPASGWHLWDHRTLQMCSRKAHLGRVTTQKLPFSLPMSLGTKTLPEARSQGLLNSAILLRTVCKGDSTGIHKDNENRLWEWLRWHNGKSNATFTVQEKKSAIKYNKCLGVLTSQTFYQETPLLLFSCSVMPHSSTPWTATHQAPLSSAVSWSSLQLCPSSLRCKPTSSSFVVPLSSCPQSFPASGSFPMGWFFTSGGQRIGASASASVLPMNIQGWILKGGNFHLFNHCLDKRIYICLKIL